MEFQVSNQLFMSPTDWLDQSGYPFIGTATVFELFAMVYNLSDQTWLNLSLWKLSEHSLFLSQNME